jgi:two-component system cell cycle response regulator DivK
MKRILYVEDEVINALVMQKFLEKEFEIVLATNAETCREAIAKGLPDVILMDINLGTSSSDGIDLFREIRGKSETAHIPMFAVTAFAMPGDRDRYIDIGFDDYFSKPISRSLILDRIREVLGS